MPKNGDEIETRKPRGRKGMGTVWGTSPADEEVGGASQAPSVGSGAEPRPKTGFDAFRVSEF